MLELVKKIKFALESAAQATDMDQLVAIKEHLEERHECSIHFIWDYNETIPGEEELNTMEASIRFDAFEEIEIRVEIAHLDRAKYLREQYR